MTKPAATSTRDQLRNLLYRHKAKVAVILPPPVAKPVVERVVQPEPVSSTPALLAPIESRQSLRLIPNELSKINAIINRTLELTGERATVTDVLRIGLKRLGESAHITREEIQSLRASDGRRHKAKG